jgi:hypothetical protein
MPDCAKRSRSRRGTPDKHASTPIAHFWVGADLTNVPTNPLLRLGYFLATSNQSESGLKSKSAQSGQHTR